MEIQFKGTPEEFAELGQRLMGAASSAKQKAFALPQARKPYQIPVESRIPQPEPVPVSYQPVEAPVRERQSSDRPQTLHFDPSAPAIAEPPAETRTAEIVPFIPGEIVSAGEEEQYLEPKGIWFVELLAKHWLFLFLLAIISCAFVFQEYQRQGAIAEPPVNSQAIEKKESPKAEAKKKKEEPKKLPVPKPIEPSKNTGIKPPPPQALTTPPVTEEELKNMKFIAPPFPVVDTK